MTHQFTLNIAFAAIFSFALFMPSAVFAQKVVVENFSALDCPQSPASEENIGKMMKEEGDLLVLSCHVRVGQEDTKFSNALCAEKKGRYISPNFFNDHAAPSIIINGKYFTKGYYQNVVNSGIKMALAENSLAQLDLKIEDGILTTTLPDQGEKGYYEIWFYAYDKAEVIPMEIQASALNPAMTYPVTYNNVVKKVARLGTWNGLGESIAIPLKNLDTDGYAIIAQGVRAGPLLAAGHIVPDSAEITP